MATIYNGYTGLEATSPYESFVNDMKAAFGFVDTDEKYESNGCDVKFYLTEDMYIRYTLAGDTSHQTVYVGKGNEEQAVVTVDNYTHRMNNPYQIIKSVSGDVLLRMRTNADEYQSGGIENNSGNILCIARCSNGLTQESDIGIYVPWSASVPTNPTPKMLITSDTTSLDVNNTGSSGATTTALLQFIVNPNSPCTMLVPAFSVGSACKTANMRVAALTPTLITGYASLNGTEYYCCGGICLLEQSE